LINPQSNKCNTCEIFRLKPDPTSDEVEQQRLHIDAWDQHTALKKGMLECAARDEALALEFDYTANYPLSKHNINDQFYKRLLWLYIFKEHLYNNGTSKMYTFTQGSAKKDSNFVASFLFDFLQPILEMRRYECVVFLSDAAGSQNKKPNSSEDGNVDFSMF